MVQSSEAVSHAQDRLPTDDQSEISRTSYRRHIQFPSTTSKEEKWPEEKRRSRGEVARHEIKVV
jgi:hypothetical protein